MTEWHIWVIKQQKFEVVKRFLERDIKEIEEIFFPTVLKECFVGKKLQKKRVPLYSGYLFLKYIDEDSKIHYKIRANPFVTTYIGLCDQASVEEMKTKEKWNVLNKKVEVGDVVEVISGPFKRCKGEVNSISGNKVTIKVRMFDREIDYTLLSEDLEIITKI
jgi:transcription antitermination factor NusG